MAGLKMINRGSYRFWLIALIHLKMINPGSYRFCLRDDIKLCHWFPKFPFLSLLINFDIKIVWNMKIGCGSWGPPLCRHLPTTTIGIISTLQNFRTKNNIPDICYKSLWKWKFHWWVDFRIYDGVPPFLEWIWRNPVFLSIGGEFMISAHHMIGFHHMICVLPIKW